MISILIPTYNRSCHLLAKILAQQCSLVDGLVWEIIVIDDGSSDAAAIASNKWCAQIEGVRLIWQKPNIGRSAIRNRAVSEAKGDWLLIVDDDVMPTNENFVAKYVRLAHKDRYDVICGGVNALSKKEDETNLRWIYDAYGEELNSLEHRKANPYACFTTQNFMARRSVFDQVRFDESLKQYGYEDALFGIELERKGLRIRHTSNPVEHLGLEPNREFVEKSELALQNLRRLGAPMTQRASVALWRSKLERNHLGWLIRLWHWCFGRLERKLLCSKYPSVHVFQLYKLGYYSRLK